MESKKLTCSDFVQMYCKDGGITEAEFYQSQIPMPDNTSPHGWAAVSNSPLAIKAHVDLFTDNSETEKENDLRIQEEM